MTQHRNDATITLPHQASLVGRRLGAGLAAIAIAVAFALAGGPARAADDDTLKVVDTEHLEWKDYPGLPGVRFVVIQGNPKEAGLYTIRVKFAPHTMSRPHWHPEARYVTVIKGTWWAGEGEKFDPNATTPVPAGGYALHAPKKVHYDGAKDEEVIVQISGIGPSGTHPVGDGAAEHK
jgi:hypothetical protein